jgi:MGT family glycosyltransferase
MSRVLFINGNVHGHINPTLALTEELVKRGEDIWYFSTDEFKDKIIKTGARFVSYGQVLQDFLASYKPTGNHPFYTLMEFMVKMDRIVISLILEMTKGVGFNYIIHDSMFGGGNILSKLLKIPAVCSSTAFAMEKLPLPPHMLERSFHPQLGGVFDAAEETAGIFGIEPPGLMDIFFKKEGLNIVYTSRYFQPNSECFDENYTFVGPSISDRNEQLDFPVEELEGKKVIYISLGTINNNFSGFYHMCMDAFGGEDVKVVLSAGKKIDVSTFVDIPDNFIVRNYIPQLEVLKRADVFISHGGLNSVSEALYYNVPVICIPISNDQPMVTKQLVSLGAGIGLKMDEITSDILKESVHKLLLDSRFRLESKKIGDSFRQAGGYKAAADKILACFSFYRP